MNVGPRRIRPGTSPPPNDLPTDVGVSCPATGQRRPRPESDRPNVGLERPVDVVDTQLEDGQPHAPPGTDGAIIGRPFGRGHIVFDEERRQIRPEGRLGGQPPPDDVAISSSALTRDGFGECGSGGPESRDIGIEIVARHRPGREPTAGVEGSERRCPHPRCRREVTIEYADQFDVGVAEPDEPVERAEPVMPPTAARLQPEAIAKLVGGRVRVVDRDDEVVDPGQHGARMTA